MASKKPKRAKRKNPSEVGHVAGTEATPSDRAEPKSRSFDAPEEPEWHRMISVAAYYRAQSRGFSDGSALEDWLFAEAQIRSLMDSS
jgi:hypothetical protein